MSDRNGYIRTIYGRHTHTDDDDDDDDNDDDTLIFYSIDRLSLIIYFSVIRNLRHFFFLYSCVQGPTT